ncbi:MAG: DNA repair protein RadC [Deltaproteobacteria bacterium]|nr:DNA repair protein RadC [Deltaproteobacteria bacterium]
MKTIKTKSKGIVSWPTNERPRERLLAEGPERMTDADLLAIILRIGSGTFREGVPGTNAYEAALSILRDFRGLRGLDRARIHDLLKVPGIGPAKAAQIKAAFELGKRLCATKLTAPAFESSLAVANHFRPRFTGKREELVIAVFLNGQNQRLGEKDITEGTPTQATVYIRRILEEALHESAAAIVLVHNHPSGNPDPSAGDDETTRDLLRACKLVGLVLIDHVIVGESEHYSYNDSGRMKELENE